MQSVLLVCSNLLTRRTDNFTAVTWLLQALTSRQALGKG